MSLDNGWHDDPDLRADFAMMAHRFNNIGKETSLESENQRLKTQLELLESEYQKVKSEKALHVAEIENLNKKIKGLKQVYEWAVRDIQMSELKERELTTANGILEIENEKLKMQLSSFIASDTGGTIDSKGDTCGSIDSKGDKVVEALTLEINELKEERARRIDLITELQNDTYKKIAKFDYEESKLVGELNQKDAKIDELRRTVFDLETKVAKCATKPSEKTLCDVENDLKLRTLQYQTETRQLLECVHHRDETIKELGAKITKLAEKLAAAEKELSEISRRKQQWEIFEATVGRIPLTLRTVKTLQIFLDKIHTLLDDELIGNPIADIKEAHTLVDILSREMHAIDTDTLLICTNNYDHLMELANRN